MEIIAFLITLVFVIWFMVTLSGIKSILKKSLNTQREILAWLTRDDEKE